MINITRWSPDTCKCIVEIDWDTDNTQIQGTHRLVSPCEFHKSNTGNDILLENQTKNKAINAIAQAHPEYATLSDNGVIIPNLSKISFSFDNNRNLNIVLSPVGVIKVSDIQTTVSNISGIGSVSIG